jgi:hypothetical protein
MLYQQRNDDVDVDAGANIVDILHDRGTLMISLYHLVEADQSHVD